MSKAADIIALLAGIITFFIVLAIRFSELSVETASDIVIKATLAFLVVSVLSKIITGKIFRSVILQKKQEITEKIKMAQKQQKEAEKKKP